MPRYALAACLALALAAVPTAAPGVRSAKVGGVPGGLHAFLLRSDEPVAHAYPRTPSFAWSPVANVGGHYQFELATSKSFEDGTLVFKDTNVAMPAETVPRQLPWMTGDPYALWAHVRWISSDGKTATPWSAPFGFNITWLATDVPQQETAPDGLIRWTPVEGATSYEVLYTDLRPLHSFQTTTNVADEREFFTFHSSLGYSMTIHWRVRAIRDVGKLAGPTNGLPVVSYGPWSPVFSSTNTPQTAGTLAPTDTISNAWATNGATHAFDLSPGFAWTPDNEVITDGVDPGSSLYRVYIFTDPQCVNRVFTGSIVGSPAFAPRTVGGPIALPTGTTALGKLIAGPLWPGPGAENSLDATGAKVTPNEGTASTSSSSSSSSDSSSSSSSGSSASSGPAMVDLWDSGWPSGRYYWTVVPVTVIPDPNATSSSSDGTSTDTPIQFQDVAVPQDACMAGQKMSFGKVSQPVVTSAGKPFVSGVAPTGRSVTAAGSRATVYASPIVAWKPAVGATTYQVDISRTLYPWRVFRRLTTPATSLVLPLSKTDAGNWYYRVRGVNEALPVGAREMSWSAPVRIKITGDQFAIVK